jgi:hypothetical protein
MSRKLREQRTNSNLLFGFDFDSISLVRQFLDPESSSQGDVAAIPAPLFFFSRSFVLILSSHTTLTIASHIRSKRHCLPHFLLSSGEVVCGLGQTSLQPRCQSVSKGKPSCHYNRSRAWLIIELAGQRSSYRVVFAVDNLDSQEGSKNFPFSRTQDARASGRGCGIEITVHCDE